MDSTELPPWPKSCFNGGKDGDETDTDCGGSCPRCARTKLCKENKDCWNDTCDAFSHACGVDCPSIMKRFSTPGKVTEYCVDTYEVSQRDYRDFINKHPSQLRQDPVCAARNPTFLPSDTASSDTSRPACTLNTFNPSDPTTMNHPVTCVDHCDAVAFCRERGVFLCGDIDAPGAWLSVLDIGLVTRDALFAACNGADEALAYPYGSTYEPKSCVTKDLSATGPLIVGSTKTCTSTSLFGPPFIARDLVGNVAEWTTACEPGSGNGPPLCKVHGGSYRDGANATCSLMEPLLSTEAFADVGFRCCG